MVKHSEAFATVSAQVDVDGCCPTVIYESDRRADEEHKAVVEMTPKEARRLARMLNRAAKAAEAIAG